MNILDTIISFFGNYEPLMGVYYVFDEAAKTLVEVQQPIPGLAGVNWPWISGVAFVLVTLFCIFKMIGGIFKGVLH